MTQSLWESEIHEEVQPEQNETASQEAELFDSAHESSFDFKPELAEEAEPGPELNHLDASAAENHPAESPSAPAAVSLSPAAVSLSVDEFTALEERILRAVSLLKAERIARAAAEERALQAEAQLREQTPLAESLQKEISVLYAERDHVRQRVERLLSQLDALEM